MIKEHYSDIQNQVTYRYINGQPQDGILSCGFMRKKTSQKSQIDYTIPYYSCFVVLSGSGEYWDETGFQTFLSPGCVVQRFPDRIHSTRIDGDGKWLEFYVSFGRQTFNALLELDLLNTEIPVKYYSEPEKQLTLFQKLLAQMSTVSDRHLGACYLEAQQIALLLTGYGQFAQNNASVISKACLLLEHDLKKELSLIEIAKELCIGYETFRKQFQHEMKMSPDNYRQQKRMTTAQMMLLEGESVKSVAKALGYSDTFTFSKQFKRFHKYAPTHFLQGK